MSRIDEQHAPWDFGDLDGYIREGEPDQAARAENWQVAIGLQAVDGLKPSRRQCIWSGSSRTFCTERITS